MISSSQCGLHNELKAGGDSKCRNKNHSRKQTKKETENTSMLNTQDERSGNRTQILYHNARSSINLSSLKKGKKLTLFINRQTNCSVHGRILFGLKDKKILIYVTTRKDPKETA